MRDLLSDSIGSVNVIAVRDLPSYSSNAVMDNAVRDLLSNSSVGVISSIQAPAGAHYVKNDRVIH